MSNNVNENIMKNFLDKKTLENKKFSNILIGPLAYLVHKMSGSGHYFLEIYRSDQLLTKTRIECSDKTETNSETIDIGKLSANKAFPEIKLNSSNGYLLFYNSREFSENHIIIRAEKAIEFDSYKPGDGNMYVLNLLRPGVYEIKSNNQKMKSKVMVAYPSLEMNRDSMLKESLRLSNKLIQESKVYEVLPNQGVIFEFNKDFTDLSVEMVKEELPKNGKSITDQLKLQTRKMIRAERAKRKTKPITK